MDKALLEFLNEKKIDMTSQDALEQWLVNRSRVACQLTFGTHNGKYSNSNVKKEVGCVALPREKAGDGLVRTGNCDCSKIEILQGLDAFGNSAALDIYSFISLILEDGRTVFAHVEDRSLYLQNELGLSDEVFISICDELLKIKPDPNSWRTDQLIKQVYFPIGDNTYHLLSLLTPSLIVSELKRRIDETWRFSENTKSGREARKNGKYHDGYIEYFGITEMRFGGTKAQNIGVLNLKRNSSVCYLLPSLPPNLYKHRPRLPRRNFFKDSISFDNYKNLYVRLYRIFSTEYNNLAIRETRENLFKAILDLLIASSWEIQNYEGGWTFREYYAGLPMHQKIWLDKDRADERQNNDAWFFLVADDMARWICSQTPRDGLIHENPLGDDEFRYVLGLIKDIKEAFV